MSLYNEVRPVNLNQVRGQEKIVAQVRAIIEKGAVPNVSLFVGPRGTGKTTIARIFARAINCSNPTEEGPCNCCASCKEIQDDSSMDVVELDAASHNKVEDVHRLIEGASYAPIGKYKVYIVDEVHMLSTAAFNALLKLLEEPPVHCRFILCTTEEHKVPVTILSRCRKFYFERISTGVIADKMATICQDRNLPYEEEALRLIAKKAEGCMRDAESLLEIFVDAQDVSFELVSSILGTTNEEVIWGIIQGIANGDFPSSYNLIREVKGQGKNLQLLVKNLIEALSDLVYYHQSKDLSLIDNTLTYKEGLQKASEKLSVTKALEICDAFSEIFIGASQGSDIGFLLETKLLRTLQLKTEETTLALKVGDMKKQLEALENAVFELRSAGPVGTVVATETPQIVESVPSTPSITFETSSANTVVEETQEEVVVEEECNPEVVTSTAATFSGSVLPGDINIPQGTEIKGNISLFDSDNEVLEEIPTPVVLPSGFNSVEDELIPFDGSRVISRESDEEATEKAVKEETDKTPSYNFDSIDILSFGGFDNLFV